MFLCSIPCCGVWPRQDAANADEKAKDEEEDAAEAVAAMTPGVPRPFATNASTRGHSRMGACPAMHSSQHRGAAFPKHTLIPSNALIPTPNHTSDDKYIMNK
jgi:hypothetical protein